MPGEFPVCLKISSALAEQVLRVPIQSPLFDQIPGTASVRARLCSSGQATAEQGNCILGGTAAGLIVVLLVGSGERIENKPELPLGRDAKGCFSLPRLNSPAAVLPSGKLYSLGAIFTVAVSLTNRKE